MMTDLPAPLLAERLPAVQELETARLKAVLLTVAINVAGVALLTLAPWSDWRTGLGLNVIDNAVLLTFVLRRRDAFLGWLMLFGLAVGLAELAADAWLVESTRTLDYSIGGGPMLWRSPLWMPLAWEVVAVQFSTLGLWLWRRLGGWGLLAVGLLGGTNIPYYEEMARPIHWWSYSGCRMISGTPWYIVVGEFGIAIALTLLARPLQLRPGPGRAIGLGLLGGAAIFVCYVVGWTVAG